LHVPDQDLPPYDVVDPAGRRSPGGTVADLRRLLPARRRTAGDGPAFTLIGADGVSLAVGADRVTLRADGAPHRHLDGLGDDGLTELWLNVLRGDADAGRAIEALDWQVEVQPPTPRSTP
jgi:hypothetical protein